MQTVRPTKQRTEKVLMKIAALFASLALAPALLMADPEPVPAPNASETNAPAGPEEIAEHAALVQPWAQRPPAVSTRKHTPTISGSRWSNLSPRPCTEAASSPKPPAPTHVAPRPAPSMSRSLITTQRLLGRGEGVLQPGRATGHPKGSARPERGLEAKVQAVSTSGEYHPNQ